MREETASEELSAWLDGELSDTEAAAIERQLERDPLLRAELDELRDVREMLRTHGPRRAPADFHARVLEAVADEPMPRAAWWRRPFGVPVEALAVAAAAVLVVLAGLELGPDAIDHAVDKEKSAAPAAPVEAPQQLEPPSKDAPPEQTVKPPPAYDVDDGHEIAFELEPKRGSEKRRAMPKSAPPPPAKGDYEKKPTAVEPEATVEPEGTAEPVPSEETAMEAEAPAGTGYVESSTGASWRYQIVKAEQDVLGDLQRLASRYGGGLYDGDQRLVRDGTLEAGASGTWFVRIPGARMKEFDGAMRQLYGAPVRADTDFSSEIVTVQIDVMVMERAQTYEKGYDNMKE